MSVLAHIVLNGSLPSEPAATQALAHILNSSADIARSFVGFLRKVDIKFELGHIRAELGHEESFPDLTIYDRHGCVRVFVENKFWAGLTDAQPVSYLEHLPDDPPSALLFVVPQQRVASIWSELKRRCAQAGLEWENASVNSIIKCSRVGCKNLLITSWTHVLEGLLDTARAGEHDTIRHDILQLQGLTNRMDSEAFLPICSDELTSEEIARRLINYSDLIEDIVQQAQGQQSCCDGRSNALARILYRWPLFVLTRKVRDLARGRAQSVARCRHHTVMDQVLQYGIFRCFRPPSDDPRTLR